MDGKNFKNKRSVLIILITILVGIVCFGIYQKSPTLQFVMGEIISYNKFNSYSNVNIRIDYFNKNSQILNNTAMLLSKYPDIYRITRAKEYLFSEPKYQYVIDKDIYIQSQGILNNEQISEIETSDLIKAIKKNNIILITNEQKYIYFNYALTLSSSLGWLYSKDLSEPSKEEEYIIELRKIDERWYTYITE